MYENHIMFKLTNIYYKNEANKLNAIENYTSNRPEFTYLLYNLSQNALGNITIAMYTIQSFPWIPDLIIFIYINTI